MSVTRPEDKVLICVARSSLDVASANRLRQLLQCDLDWQYLMAMAQRHCLIPLLHCHLNSAGSGMIPPPVLSQLVNDCQESTRHSLFLSGELLKIMEILQSNGIKAIPFKGPTLALCAYGELGLRQFGDLDILVRKYDIPAVRELLVRRKFRATPELNRSQEAALVHFDCSHNFVSEDGVYVDVHWDIVARYHGFRFDPNRWWDRLQSISIAGRPVPTLAPEDLLIVLCLHGYTHFWERLGWICDVAGLIDRRKDIDWELVLQNAATMGCRRILSLGLLLASELLGAPVPEEVWNTLPREPTVRKLASEIQEQLFAPVTRSRGVVEGILVHVRMRERRRDRLRSCFRLATTPRVYDWMLVPVPDSLLVLHYLLRPLRLAGKYGARLLKGFLSKENSAEGQ